MKADLHVHSRFSKRPSQWILQKIDCPESFTEPMEIYSRAMDKGMDLVTITDHNTLGGSLEIAHLPNTFVSEEVTTYFPEDGCKVHVLAYRITEAVHEDIQKARENIHDLASYLTEAGIPHAVAHPLYSINDRLTADHIEKLFLLFKTFEMNGARNEIQNVLLKDILGLLTAADIQRMEDRHGISATHSTPWQKNIIGGSDDHSSINIARKFTSVSEAHDLSTFLEGITHGRTTVFGKPATPQTMAHNLYGIAYQYYRNKFGLDRHVTKDPFLLFLDRILSCKYAALKPSWTSRLLFFHNGSSFRSKEKRAAKTPQELFLRESRKLLANDPELRSIVKDKSSKRTGEECWFRFVSRVSDRVLANSSQHLLDQLSGADFFNIFTSIGSAGALTSMLAPYFIAHNEFIKDRQLSDELLERFSSHRQLLNHRMTPPRIAHFTDTLYDVNGVALTLQQQIKNAVRTGKDLTLITCDGAHPEAHEGVMNFKPVGDYALPEYPELRLHIPPFLDMLRYCYEQGFTHIHSATPGPIGLAALAISRILHLPLRGTYHTSLPQYAGQLTGDSTLEQLTWKFVLWYYNQMDTIYVPSKATGAELIEQGVASNRIQVYPRGVDLDQFHPGTHSSWIGDHPELKNRVKLLYVGRVSREKNLDILVEAFLELHRNVLGVALVVVGDGPYLDEMKQRLVNTPTVFTGYLRGDQLAGVYAACDVFIFPSTTDTFGNVVLEAQASGIPAIVTDMGGPRENVLPGKTGMVINANDPEALIASTTRLIKDPLRLQAMKRNARLYMEQRSFEKTFDDTWKLFVGEPAEPEESLPEAV